MTSLTGFFFLVFSFCPFVFSFPFVFFSFVFSFCLISFLLLKGTVSHLQSAKGGFILYLCRAFVSSFMAWHLFLSVSLRFRVTTEAGGKMPDHSFPRLVSPRFRICGLVFLFFSCCFPLFYYFEFSLRRFSKRFSYLLIGWSVGSLVDYLVKCLSRVGFLFD